MTSDLYVDLIRGLNAILALITFTLLLLARRKLWQVWNERMKDLWYGVLIMVLVLGESSLEDIYQDNQGGPRVYLTTLALVIFLTGILKGSRGEYTKQPG